MSMLQIFLAFSLSACLLFLPHYDYSSLPNPAPVQNQPDRVVFFYIDCGCTCQLESVRSTSKYWIITDQIYSAKFNDLNSYLTLFRQVLKERFKDHEELVGSLVIRYQESKEEASKAREQKIEGMGKKGYTIIEAKFNPPARN
ncbi:MAG: hypothetical protein WBV94_03635 [Blastocatellia bacterium]